MTSGENATIANSKNPQQQANVRFLENERCRDCFGEKNYRVVCAFDPENINQCMAANAAFPQFKAMSRAAAMGTMPNARTDS